MNNNDCMDYLRKTSVYKECKEYTLDEKIQILGLSAERAEQLRNMSVIDIYFNYDEHPNCPYYSTINCNDIIGTRRYLPASSWLDLLNTHLHKMVIFEKYNPEGFKSFLNNEQETGDGFPEVIKKNGKYYIAGNGLHRLTIAKCVGNLMAKVIVRDW